MRLSVQIEVKARPYRERLPDGGLRLNLHAGQAKARRSKARFVVILAGIQSGKTCFEADWLKEKIDELGPGDYFAATASFPLLDKKLLPEFKEVFINIWHLGEYLEGKKELRYHDGKTRIFFLSADSPEAAESMTAKAGVMDEAGQTQFKRGTWLALQGRVSLSQGPILMATSLYNFGWLKNDVYDRAKAGGKDFEIIQFDSIANPLFPRAEYERMKMALPSWLFNMRYRGQYERPVGIVYDAFNEATCKIKRFELPKTWPRYVGHDFGSANPAAMFYAQDPATGYFYAYQEYLPGPGRSPYQHVQIWKEMTAGLTVLKRAGGSHQEEEIRAAYTQQGWVIQEPKLRSVQAQIERVYGLHKHNKLFVFDDLAFYLDQKLSFSYKLNDHYQPTDEFENEASMHLLAAERGILSDFTPESVHVYQGPSLPLRYAGA